MYAVFYVIDKKSWLTYRSEPLMLRFIRTLKEIDIGVWNEASMLRPGSVNRPPGDVKRLRARRAPRMRTKLPSPSSPYSLARHYSVGTGLCPHAPSCNITFAYPRQSYECPNFLRSSVWILNKDINL